MKPLREKVFGLGYRSDPDVLAFDCLYQVACLLKKFGSGDMSADMQRRAIDDYVVIEDTLRSFPLVDRQSPIITEARSFIRELFEFADAKIPEGRHGPGSTAEGKLPSGAKYEQWHLPPYSNLGYPSAALILEHGQPSTRLDGQDPFMSRLCLVPKDWNKARSICAEPSFLQYVQQGLGRRMDAMFDKARQSGYALLDISNQDTNAQVALEHSSLKYYATIDLSAASDRLSCDVVSALLPPLEYALVRRARSKRTLLPDGTVLELRKFGSMGNATTFPVQTVCFWGLVAAVMLRLGFSRSEARNNVWVYGDDIICPSIGYSLVVDALEEVGLKVNGSKSFSQGRFRESCGMHAFNGKNITPAYLRTVSRDGSGAVSMCATANLLSKKGYEEAASQVFSLVEENICSRLPYTCDTGLPTDSYGGDVGIPSHAFGRERKPQLTRILSPYATLQDAIDANRSVGVPIKVCRYHYPCVLAWGLFENPVKRHENAFANTRALGVFLQTNPWVGHDRGYIPGATMLTQKLVRLQ